MAVVGLVVHFQRGTYQLAGGSGWGLISLPANRGTVELLRRCGKANLLPLRGEGYPDVLAQGGEHTDGQAELVAKPGKACSVRGLSVCANVCIEEEEGGGFDVE